MAPLALHGNGIIALFTPTTPSLIVLLAAAVTEGGVGWGEETFDQDNTGRIKI